MRNTLIFSLLFFTSFAFSQVAQISGQVLDAEFNEEPLAFAEVRVQGLDLEAIADENGNYKLELAPGSYNLEFAFIGYETLLVSAEVEVRKRQIQLDPVVLQGKKYARDYGLSLSDNSTASNEE